MEVVPIPVEARVVNDGVADRVGHFAGIRVDALELAPRRGQQVPLLDFRFTAHVWFLPIREVFPGSLSGRAVCCLSKPLSVYLPPSPLFPSLSPPLDQALLSLETVVIRECTRCLFDPAFDLISSSTHYGSPFVHGGQPPSGCLV